MTSVIRYVRNISSAPNVGIEVSSHGSDTQLIAFDITLAAGLAPATYNTILTWTGAGEIKSILSLFIRDPATGEVIPYGEIYETTHMMRTLDAARKTVTLCVLQDGPTINPGSVVSMLLLIGS